MKRVVVPKRIGRLLLVAAVIVSILLLHLIPVATTELPYCSAVNAAKSRFSIILGQESQFDSYVPGSESMQAGVCDACGGCHDNDVASVKLYVL